MLPKCFLRLFLDSSATAMYHLYLQTGHWQTFLSTRFVQQMFCSKVLRGLKNLKPSLPRLFSYRFGKSLFRWCCKLCLIGVFPHTFWLALHLHLLPAIHFCFYYSQLNVFVNQYIIGNFTPTTTTTCLNLTRRNLVFTKDF